jgi:hypothetical protein
MNLNTINPATNRANPSKKLIVPSILSIPYPPEAKLTINAP